MSDKQIADKLSIKPGYKIALLNAPDELIPQFEAPGGIEILDYIDLNIDLIHAFVKTKIEYEDVLDRIHAHALELNTVWIAYPNKGTEINTELLNSMASKWGFKSLSTIEINDSWSSVEFQINNK